MIESVKATHPNTPLTVYANGSGGLLERLGATGADVVGLDWTTDMADARQRLGTKSVQVGPCFFLLFFLFHPLLFCCIR
jgi:uroporphyrinogen decarboxylase